MTKERDYLTLDEVEEYTGIKKNSLYYYLKMLDIKTHKFTLDKRAYISLADANRIKEVKDTPWLAGEKPSQKPEKAPVSKSVVQTTRAVSERPKKRSYKARDTDLPAGCIMAKHFGENHGVSYGTFYDHMVIGRGPGTVPGEESDPMLPVKDLAEHSERKNPSRPKETQRYLTQEQQAAALEFWKRHDVSFTECERVDCPCHKGDE